MRCSKEVAQTESTPSTPALAGPLVSWKPNAEGLAGRPEATHPSGAGCLSTEGDGLQPANSVQFFALRLGLVVF